MAHKSNVSERLLRVSSVAKRLDCSVGYIYRLIEEGRLRAIRIGIKKGIRIPESAFREFLEGSAVEQY